MRSYTTDVFRFATGAAIALLLAGCGGGGDFIPVVNDNPRASEYAVHGIDVSKYQGDVDWNAVANAGVKFAWIKATEGGDHADERFQANWEGARAAGIPRGAYHFVYWCRPWNEEMAWFEANVPVEANALPPVLDVEATPTSRTCRRHLDRASVIPEMRAMLQEMERHYGKRPVIYSTVDFYEGILSGGELTEYPIWVRSVKHHPAVKYAGRDWSFWQYQSDGYVPGVQGKVDRNAFAGTPQQWRAFLDPDQAREQPPARIETAEAQTQ